MRRIVEILARELSVGTFDKSCSANEHFYIRKFIANVRRTLEDSYADYGLANGWSEPPLQVKQCHSALHTVTKKGVGKCLTEIRCDKCKYTYQIDSSD